MARDDSLTRTRIALLRGINVGRAKRVAMADLRMLLEGLGYGDVRTLLNSGNVVFTVPGVSRADPAPRIEEALERRLKVSSRVLVLTATELARAIAWNPLLAVAKDPSRLLVTVLAEAAHRRRLLPLARQDWAPGALAIGARVAYLWCPEGILASALNAAVSQALGDNATSRNWATIQKLATIAGIAT